MTFKSFLLIAATAFIGTVGITTAASATDFHCPKQQITVTTSGISYPWTADSQALRLTGLKVEKAGASSKLACIYGDGAMVLRHPAPVAQPNCSVVGASKFVCTPAIAVPVARAGISYSAPLTTGLPPVIGSSLQALSTQAQASVGPYANVPMAGTRCSSCHTPPAGWSRPALCALGQVYAGNRSRIFTSPTPGFVGQHPFGGQFKTAMANWAQSGCR